MVVIGKDKFAAFEARWAIFWLLSGQIEQKLSKTLFIHRAQCCLVFLTVLLQK